MRNKLPRFSLKQLILILVGVILVGLLLERFITQGTFLGYRVRHIENKIVSSSKSEQPSEACSRLPDKEVGNVLDTNVKRIADNLGDTKDPLFFSVCSYRTEKAPYRSVTIVMRDAKDESSAKKQVDSYGTRKEVKAVRALGDQAYYLPQQRQTIVRTGKRIITVTVSDTTDASKVSSEDANMQLIKKLL